MPPAVLAERGPLGALGHVVSGGSSRDGQSGGKGAGGPGPGVWEGGWEAEVA